MRDPQASENSLAFRLGDIHQPRQCRHQKAISTFDGPVISGRLNSCVDRRLPMPHIGVTNDVLEISICDLSFFFICFPFGELPFFFLGAFSKTIAQCNTWTLTGS